MAVLRAELLGGIAPAGAVLDTASSHSRVYTEVRAMFTSKYGERPSDALHFLAVGAVADLGALRLRRWHAHLPDWGMPFERRPTCRWKTLNLTGEAPPITTFFTSVWLPCRRRNPSTVAADTKYQSQSHHWEVPDDKLNTSKQFEDHTAFHIIAMQSQLWWVNSTLDTLCAPRSLIAFIRCTFCAQAGGFKSILIQWVYCI